MFQPFLCISFKHVTKIWNNSESNSVFIQFAINSNWKNLKGGCFGHIFYVRQITYLFFNFANTFKTCIKSFIFLQNHCIFPKKNLIFAVL